MEVTAEQNSSRIHGFVGFIGCGNMAKAIAFPLFEKEILNPKNVIVSATSQKNLKDWEKFHCKTTLKNEEVMQVADIIIWAVKPQIFPGCVDALSKSDVKVPCDKIISHVSIMGGISLANFQAKVEKIGSPVSCRCFRTLPNIGLQVQCGVTVFSGPPDTTEKERQLVQSFFKPNGLTYEVPEHLVNAYGSLSGSGIGFMFPIIEALSDAGVKLGIPRDISLEIAAQVMKGGGELILHDKIHPGQMKDDICCPGGTTIAGLAALENGKVRSSIINAVEVTTLRAQALGGSSK